MTKLAQNNFNNPFAGDLVLERYPKDAKLQAWDASDELILQTLLKKYPLDKLKILIMQDSFGALSLSLKNFKITTYTDSYVSKNGFILNGFDQEVVSDLEKLKGCFDLVILKNPKSLSFLEDILAHLTHLLNPNAELIVGGMVKGLTQNTFNLIEKYIGPTHTSLSQKKARLIFAKLTQPKIKSPYPKKVKIEFFKNDFLHHSNIFSRNKLDMGTRFFLDHIPSINAKTILDLGCANGIIGIKAKLKNTEAKILFADESFMALKSAKSNYETEFDDKAQYIWTNCYENQEDNSLDLVLCNPPFHQNNIIGDFIAHQMFNDAKKALKLKAKIRVIGNLHLGYHKKLKKIFGNYAIIARNEKFMIVDAVKEI